MRRQPVTDKAAALDRDDDEEEPEPEPEPEPKVRPVRYTKAVDRSTFERDFAEVRLFKRLGGVAVFALLIAFALSRHSGG